MKGRETPGSSAAATTPGQRCPRWPWGQRVTPIAPWSPSLGMGWWCPTSETLQTFGTGGAEKGRCRTPGVGDGVQPGQKWHLGPRCPLESPEATRRAQRGWQRDLGRARRSPAAAALLIGGVRRRVGPRGPPLPPGATRVPPWRWHLRPGAHTGVALHTRVDV